jgi:translation initiation factor 1A
MPNKKGGKKYKKSNHASTELVLFEKQSDQMYGRVIKLLGGCNVLVYCNDDIQRLCHIRGSMRKKVWISSGDIVIISIRDLSTQIEIQRGATSNIERGDICSKYDIRLLQRLQSKDPTINSKLFSDLEKQDSNSNKLHQIPDGFVFDETASVDNDDSNEKNTYVEVDEDAELDIDDI